MFGAHPFANPEPRDPGEAKRLKVRHAFLVLPQMSSLTLIINPKDQWPSKGCPPHGLCRAKEETEEKVCRKPSPLEGWPVTSSCSITWELVRSANSQPHPKSTEYETCNKIRGGFICSRKFWGPACCTRQSGN